MSPKDFFSEYLGPMCEKRALFLYMYMFYEDRSVLQTYLLTRLSRKE